MIDFGLVLLRPWWLLAVPAVALLALMLSRHTHPVAGWKNAVQPQLMAALKRLGRILPGARRSLWPPALVGIVTAIALVGPASRSADQPLFRNLAGVVIAVDLSRSVADGGQLTQAITAARWVADGAASRPIALIVYAGDAYLASAFTTDARALGTTIAVLDAATIPDTGSRPERALGLARRLLADAEVVAGDVILVTDGGGMTRAGIDEAEAIRAAGSRVSTIFVEPVNVPPGMPVADRAILDAVAEAGGGVSATAADPVRVVDAAVSGHLVQSEIGMLLWRDYGRYLLILALLPAAPLFRRSVL